jgi:hypothetical protein
MEEDRATQSEAEGRQAGQGHKVFAMLRRYPSETSNSKSGFHFEKGLPLLPSENPGAICGIYAASVIL